MAIILRVQFKIQVSTSISFYLCSLVGHPLDSFIEISTLLKLTLIMVAIPLPSFKWERNNKTASWKWILKVEHSEVMRQFMLMKLIHNGTNAKKIRGSLVCGYQNVNRYTSIGAPNQIMVWKWDFCDQTSKF